MQRANAEKNTNFNILGQVVEVNASIRKVIDVSSVIRLNAINASLMARRAGMRSKGFAVVASELRMFSQALENAMLGLGEQVSALVKNVAATQKRERKHRLFIKTKNAMANKAGLINDVIDKAALELRRMQEVAAEDWRRLGMRIRQLLRACGTGVALSWSAKIEAVHGQELSGALAQVAEAIEVTVSSINDTLIALSRMIADQQKA